MESSPVGVVSRDAARRRNGIAMDARRLRSLEAAIADSVASKSPRQLFCEQLGFRPCSDTVPLDNAGPQERDPLAAPPSIVAAAGQGAALRVVHLKLGGMQFPVDGARPAILWLLREHPLSLIFVSVEGRDGWQLVSGGPPSAGSPVLRRISVHSRAPVSGTARLLAFLDLNRLPEGPEVADEIELRRVVDAAFDVEGLVRRYLRAHRRQLALLERALEGGGGDPHFRREVALRLLNWLMVEGLLRSGGWDAALVDALLGPPPAGSEDVPFPAALEAKARRELLSPFPFTLREPTSDDREVAVGPELLGVIRETRAPGRRQRGSFYTPPPVVQFMVRESLRGYLKQALPGDTEAAIARLLDERNPASLRDPEAALHALRRVRICDPACGTGGFLLGALRELLQLRDCLVDPFPPDLRALETVLNSLYAVELDPNAAELARTRLKLALLATCDPSDPPPLPDLSLQIAVGDGLLSPSPEGEWPEEIEERLAFRYARTRGRWELAAVGSRSELEARMAALREEFVSGMRGGKPARGFDWAVELPELFAAGGFDVVLMNPPYLSASRVPGEQRRTMRAYLKELKPVYGFTADLYVHFFYRALQLLKPGGTLAALTSDSYLTNSTKESLRRELLRNTVQLVMPLGSGLFPATVYPAITVVRKGRAGDGPYSIRFCSRRDGAAVGHESARLVIDAASVAPSSLYEDSFGAIFFEPTAENRRLFSELLSDRTPIWAGGREFLPLGEVAPALDTGIHSGNVRHKLFYEKLPRGRRLPRLLQGTQMVRYGIWWECPEARYRYVDVEYRPDPLQMGVGRGGRPSGRKEYWRFSGAPENHTVPERILLRQTADEPFASYIWQGDEAVYTDNTVHTLLLSEEGKRRGLSYRYLLALLNSAPLRTIYRAIAQERGRTLPQVKTGLINRIPVVMPRGAEQQELEALVSEIQGIQSESGFPLTEAAATQIAKLQASIDERLNALYGL